MADLQIHEVLTPGCDDLDVAEQRRLIMSAVIAVKAAEKRGGRLLPKDLRNMYIAGWIAGTMAKEKEL